MFTVIPVICFGYQCHVNAVPIYACLENKTLKEFSKSITVSLIIVFTAYTLTATFGYLTFGVKINDDLLRSYDAKDASVLVAVIMYLIKTYTSYPLNLFCARTAIEGVWIEVFRLNTDVILQYEKKRRIFIVTVWFVFSLLVALFIPNITLVINYLGALAATFMFIFPGNCQLFDLNFLFNFIHLLYFKVFVYCFTRSRDKEHWWKTQALAMPTVQRQL